MEVVINRKPYGKFELSPLAQKYLLDKKGIKTWMYAYIWGNNPYNWQRINNADEIKEYDYDDIFFAQIDAGNQASDIGNYIYPVIDHDDPNIINIIQELGDKANACNSNLQIIDIPDNQNYVICCGNDGVEHVKLISKNKPIQNVPGQLNMFND